MKKEIYLLGALFLAFFILNYSFLDSSLQNFLDDSKIVHVSRIIDGDTIVTSDNEHIRLLGINSPEKNEFLHDESENFLNQIVDKNVSLKFGKEKTLDFETEAENAKSKTSDNFLVVCSSNSANSKPPEEMASAEITAGPPALEIIATLFPKGIFSKEKAFERSKKSSKLSHLIIPASFKASSKTISSPAIAPVWDCMAFFAAFVLPGFKMKMGFFEEISLAILRKFIPSAIDSKYSPIGSSLDKPSKLSRLPDDKF